MTVNADRGGHPTSISHNYLGDNIISYSLNIVLMVSHRRNCGDLPYQFIGDKIKFHELIQFPCLEIN